MGAVEFVISLKDKATSGISRIAQEFSKAKTNADTLTGSISSLRSKGETLRIARDSSTSIKEIRKLNDEIAKTERQINQLENLPPKGFISRMRELGGGMVGKIGGALAGAFAVSSAVNFGEDVVDVTAKFEKYRVVLGNTFQDMSKGDAAMAMITDFAAKTPFQVDELTGAYVKLVNRGITPTKEQMTSMGDLASSQGKSFDQLVEAAMDAQTGEFERLKEFGIRASRSGDQVSFTFKGQTKTMKMTAGAVQDYIYSLGQVPGVAGGMAAISGTLGGQLSNLADSTDIFKKAIGDRLAPAVGWVVTKMQGFYTWGQKNMDILLPIAGMIGALALAMGVYSVATWIAAKANNELTKKIIQQNIAMAMNPYVLIAMAVIALVLYLVHLYKTSEKVRAFFDGFAGAFKAMIAGFMQWIRGVWEGVKQIAAGIWQVITAVFAPIINYYKFLWSIIVMIWGYIQQFLSWVWSGISSFFSSVWDGTTSVFSAIFNWVKDKFMAIVGFLKTIFSPISDFFGNIFNGLIESVKSVFNWMRENVLNPLMKAGGWVLKKLGIDIGAINAGFKDIGKGASNIGNVSKDYAAGIAKGAKEGAAKGVSNLRKEKKEKENAGIADAKIIGANDNNKKTDDKTNNKTTTEAVASGGTRNNQTTINLGKMVENIVFNGGVSENSNELTRQVEEALLRVLYAAQSAG